MDADKVSRALSAVRQWSSDLHWFCPRRTEDDNDIFFPEDRAGVAGTPDADQSPRALSDRRERISQSSKRTQLAMDAMLMFAFNGEQAVESQEYMRSNLNQQLLNCTVCVREFHKARANLMSGLQAEFDVDGVANFMRVFDEETFKRLRDGLKSAKKQLLEASSRDIKNISVQHLGKEELSAIFEVLNCIPALENEAFLKEYFDEPFKLLQTKKRLKCPSYVPAQAYFLFRNDHTSVTWATLSWEKMTRKMIPAEFDFCVRDPLHQIMSRLQLTDLHDKDVPKFWAGAKVIVQQMDSDLVKHSLRALPYDICKLALDHLQLDKSSFLDLLQTAKNLLELIGPDFWNATNLMSPSVWLEQFFQSVALKRQLGRAAEQPQAATKLLDCSFDWMSEFLKSIRPMNQPHVCRAITNQLFDTLPQNTNSAPVKEYFRRRAFDVLAESVDIVSKSHTSRAAGAEMAEILTTRMQTLVDATSTGGLQGEKSAQLLGQLLTLNSRILLEERRLLQSSKPLDDNSCKLWSGVWSSAFQALRWGDMLLAQALLSATSTLNSTETFVVKHNSSLSKSALDFNSTLKQVSALTVGLLSRIAGFPPDKIQDLIANKQTANYLLSHLFCFDPNVRYALIDMLETVTDKQGRHEALADAVKTYPVEVLEAFSSTLQSISVTMAYEPARAVIPPCEDVLKALVNPTDGLLRSRELSSEDSSALKRFWHALWTNLSTTFNSAEKWSTTGYDKKTTAELCREVTDFAVKASETFGVVAGALERAHGRQNDGESVTKELVKAPALTMDCAVKWLRLRDANLLGGATTLVCTLLSRLKQNDMRVSDRCLEYIKGAYVGGTNVNLDDTMRAKLRTAWEYHTGESMLPEEMVREARPATSTPKAAATKLDMDKWASKASQTRTHDLGIRGADRLPLSFKGSAAARREAEAKAQAAKEAQSRDFISKRKADSEAKRKADAELVQKKRREAAGLTGLEGSGVHGLGVYDKEHAAPKGANIMVTSDDESDSGDDWERDLFGPRKKSATPSGGGAGARPVPKPQGPTKKTRLLRSAHDMRARLTPDLSQLHKSILMWEYFNDNTLPEGTANYSGVVDSFRNPVEYQSTFQPLLLLEAWNGFMKAREEAGSNPTVEFRVMNRSTVDAFCEISASIEHKDVREFSEGDVVLISRAPRPAESADEPHCLVYVAKIHRKKAHVEVAFRALPRWSIIQSTKADQVLRAKKIMSITPLEREYGALVGLQYYDLCDEITKGKASPLLDYKDETLAVFEKTYKLNKAQAKAIKSAIDNDCFTLIQGPPGSGKTKTITAIVGSLLTGTLRAGGVPTMTTNADGSQMAKKLLVCAPSNAAVDELVLRLKDGVLTTNGEHHKINVVRIGRAEAVSTQVRDVTLEELISKRLNTNSDGSAMRDETQKIMKQHQDLSAQVNATRAQVHEAEQRGENTAQLEVMRKHFNELRQAKANLSQKIDHAKEAETQHTQQAEAERRRIQQQIITESHVICATLSGSGHDMFQNLKVEFETVVIDEAAQCVELSALIPLKYGCAKCILVGDPQQLPPTVFSRHAAQYKYEQSLFVRMQQNSPQNVHLLDTQYRMHPAISNFPSQTFYEGRLQDGPDMAALRERPWHAAELLGPFRFFDVHGQHQASPMGHSLINLAEIRVAMQLYQRLLSDFPQVDIRGKVGIITPYKSQLHELRRRFQGEYGADILSHIEFNTTDAFQGRESEIIMFSCVRASPAGGIGFLQDIRRMNVGLTRAKSSLWVLGNSQSLMKGDYWAKLIEHARAKNSFTEGNHVDKVLAQRSNMRSKPIEWHGDEDQEKVKAAAHGRSSTSTASSKGAKQAAKRPGDEDINMEDAPSAKYRRSENPPSVSEDVEMEDLEREKPAQIGNKTANIVRAKGKAAGPKTGNGHAVKPPAKPHREGVPPHLRKKQDLFVRKPKPPPRP